MKRFKNILFFADRDDGLKNSLDRIVRLSESNSARLTIMDVTPKSELSDFIDRTYSVNLNEQLREKRLQALEQLVDPYSDSGIPIYTKVVSGTPFIEIIRAVQRNDYDLVVKVAQHDTGLLISLFGSTDMHLLRKCPCPVWIDHLQQQSEQSEQPGYQRILAAVDPFDDESSGLPQLVMDLATSMAEREHARLDVIHAWRLPGESMLAHGLGRIERNELDAMLERKEQHHREAFDKLLFTYDLDSQADNVHLVKGSAAEVISTAVTDWNIDLIVMGTLGRVGIPGLFIGNTAEEVLRETRAAALTVKPTGFITPVQ